MKKLKDFLFSPKAFLVVSVLMMIGGLTVDILAWLHIVARSEPPLVVHLSTFALIFAGYGNILTAIVNKDIKKEK